MIRSSTVTAKAGNECHHPSLWVSTCLPRYHSRWYHCKETNIKPSTLLESPTAIGKTTTGLLCWCFGTSLPFPPRIHPVCRGLSVCLRTCKNFKPSDNKCEPGTFCRAKGETCGIMGLLPTWSKGESFLFWTWRLIAILTCTKWNGTPYSAQVKLLQFLCYLR